MVWNVPWPGDRPARNPSSNAPARSPTTPANEHLSSEQISDKQASTGGSGDRPVWTRLCTKAAWEADILAQWLQGYDIPVRKQDIGIGAYLGGAAATTLWVPTDCLNEARNLLDSEDESLD